MARLYLAAEELGAIKGINRQTEFGILLNASSQNVYAWENRGPSKEIKLTCQNKFGINATWVDTGAGEMFVGTNSSSTPRMSPQILSIEKPKTDRERIIEEIVALLSVTNDFGVGVVLRESRVAASEHPQKTQKSS